MPFKKAGVVTISSAEDARKLLYQDLSDSSPTLQRAYAALVPQSLASFWSATTYAAWRRFPTAYIVCHGDLPIRVEMIYGMLRAARAEGAPLDVVIDHDVGHSSMVTQPVWTAKALRFLAGEELEEIKTELLKVETI